MWNTLVIQKVYTYYSQGNNGFSPTSRVLKGHIRSAVFSLWPSLEFWGRFNKTLLKKANETSFFKCTYLRQTCVCYRTESLQLATAVVIAQQKVRVVSK